MWWMILREVVGLRVVNVDVGWRGRRTCCVTNTVKVLMCLVGKYDVRKV